MSRIFIQEADRIRIAAAAQSNRARRGALASYVATLVIGMVLIFSFLERLP
ncbi:MAG: hypothetical protein AAAB35_10355 [Phyllobacterium sp.]|uniref:hypothetical protein n=1 Tax=Phyllobacterium sp. TaxID=1871046 RepID=UPI0030F05490